MLVGRMVHRSSPSSAPNGLGLGDRQDKPSPSRALIGLFATIVGGLLAFYWIGVAWEIAPILAIVWVAVFYGVPFARQLRHARNASPLDPPGPSTFASLSRKGDEVLTEGWTVVRDVLIVLGWAVIAVIAAALLALVVSGLPANAQAAGGAIILVVFATLLIGGPFWTIRRFKRR